MEDQERHCRTGCPRGHPSLGAVLTPDEVDKSISGDTAKLYRMIWSRFMASQMADCQQDTVSVTVSAANYRFKASGYTVTFDGFTVLYEEATDEKEKKETALLRWSRVRC